MRRVLTEYIKLEVGQNEIKFRKPWWIAIFESFCNIPFLKPKAFNFPKCSIVVLEDLLLVYFCIINERRILLKIPIGIGRSLTAPPSHTKQHTGPYCAIRLIRQVQIQGNESPRETSGTYINKQMTNDG